MHLWDRSGCSRVRGMWWTRLRGHTDYPCSRRDILDDEEVVENREKLTNWVKISNRIVKLFLLGTVVNSPVWEHLPVQELQLLPGLGLKK